jgi:hypothetical protein
MAPIPIHTSAAWLDLSPRVQAKNTPLLAPGLNSETVIMTLTLPSEPAIVAGVQLQAATDSTTQELRIRRTDRTGTLVVAGGAQPVTPGALLNRSLLTFDPLPVPSQQVYVLTSESVGASAATPNFQTTFVAIVV